MPAPVSCAISNRQWVRPSFSLALRAASSVVDCQSLLDVFSPWHLRSKATSSAWVGVLLPLGLSQTHRHFLIALACIPAHNALHGRIGLHGLGVDPLIFAMQQTGFFQNAQHKDKQFAVYLQRQTPPDAAQGGVIGHGFTGGKAQESPQGQGIASCTGRCRAQSRCPRNSRSRACEKNGPTGWTCGRVFRRRMERTAFWGGRQMLPHAGAFGSSAESVGSRQGR